jgi:flagella basal body P-ring formation protein FlgA
MGETDAGLRCSSDLRKRRVFLELPHTMHTFARRLQVAMLLPAAAIAAAAHPAPLPQGPARTAIEKFVQVQAAGLPGKVTVTIDAPASGPLPACDAPEPFLPRGTSAWGRVSLGMRCPGERPWTRFVAIRVAVEGRYFVAAETMEAGHALSVRDLAERSGDLTALPGSIVADAKQLAGTLAVNRIPAGTPLRKDMLRARVVIEQGQNVRLLAQGEGFVASTQGKAMAKAAVGALLQVKTGDGRLVSGVADESGQVRLAQ